MKLFLLTFLLLRATVAAAAGPFACVMIDAETEKIHGPVPLDRALLAQAIERVGEAGAKAVILKFFLDLPRNEESDLALEKAIGKVPVVLQACFQEDGEERALASKFTLKVSGAAKPLAGGKGYLPLERFAKKARDIGFVDLEGAAETPLFESYQGKFVKALPLCALEIATGQKADFSENGIVRLGGYKLGHNARGMHPVKISAKEQLDYLPFHHVLGTPVEDWKSKVAGAVVILGYDGERMHRIETESGPIKAHRFFIFSVFSLADELGLRAPAK